MTKYRNPEQAANDFLNMLKEAAKNVAEEWFQLSYAPFGGTTQQKYRERVYCYELYHQIRMLHENQALTDPGEPRYVLSGEIDKAGLNVIRDRRPKPDFVWHVAGDAHRNSVVMEVKAVIGLTELNKDIETLGAFLSERGPGYACGVLLVFGQTSEENLRELALKAADQVQALDRPILRLTDVERRRIHLLLHSVQGEGVNDLGTLERPEIER